MAINSGRLSVQPTIKQEDLKTTVVDIYPVVPGNPYVGTDENGALISVSTLPQLEGQIAMHKIDSEVVEMYVVVDMSGTLTWKRTNLAFGLLNTTTGRPWDTLQYDIIG